MAAAAESDASSLSSQKTNTSGPTISPMVSNGPEREEDRAALVVQAQVKDKDMSKKRAARCHPHAAKKK